MRTRKLAIGLLLVAACGGKGSSTGQSAQFIAGFNPPAAQPGYTRYVLPPVRAIQPGKEGMWCQWVTAPFDHDVDVMNVTGSQSVGGHHIVMYGTTGVAPVGSSRECNDTDLVSVRYLGAIGGEGINGSVGVLPPGVVFRLHAGQSLMANVHYINYTKQTIDGQGVMDLQYVPVDKTRTVASLFTNLDVDHISVPAGKDSSLDVFCTMKQDMSFFIFANHMHVLGAAAKTEVIHPDGKTELIHEDPKWSPEFRFNPVLHHWPLEQPLVFKQGDRLHTHCDWSNNTSTDATFPTEMCVGFGFYIGDGAQIDCIDDQWTE